jgi:hypothetical protein
MNRRMRAALAVTGAAVLFAPAGAEAATIVAPECSRVVLGEKTVPVQGTGFTPNSFVTLKTADGQSVGGAATDAAGNFVDSFFGPSFPTGVEQQALQLTGTDSQGVAAVPVPFNVVKITATLPDRARPTSRVRIRAYGFTPNQTVYLHIRRGGKTRGSFKISRANSACGIASRRLRYMPLKRYSTGTYDYYFQHSRKFDRSQPGVKLSISIIRRVRFR